MHHSHIQKIIASVLIGVFIVTAALSVRNQSSTWDDPYHLTAGVSQWQTGDPRLNADHPPLARLLGGLPALFMDVPKVAQTAPTAWQAADIINSTNGYFSIVDDRLLWPGRICMLSLSALLGWLLYRWCSELHGEDCAWFPLVLLAFCPVLLGNAALVMTDMAATTFIFASLYTWWRYTNNPSLRNLLFVCLSVMAAFASKYSSILLVPLFLLLGCIAVFSRTSVGETTLQRCKKIGIGLAAIAVVTIVGINVIYFFDGTMLTPGEYAVRAQQSPGFGGFIQLGAGKLSSFWPAWLAVPLPFYYVCGILGQIDSVRHVGHLSYFLGDVGPGGWRNYFLVLFLVKLSIPMLILIGLGALRAFYRISREWWNLLFLASPALLLIWLGSIGNVQIGIRHMLPALPCLFLLATYTLKYRLSRVGWTLVGALLVWNEASSLEIHPDYLMYFNFIGGGAQQGWRISISGDDQGQSDAELLRWLKSNNVNELAYGGNGWGGVILNRAGIATKSLPCADTGELVAAHIGNFLMPQTLDVARCYEWMRLREPDKKIGYNIFIYNAHVAAAGRAGKP